MTSKWLLKKNHHKAIDDACKKKKKKKNNVSKTREKNLSIDEFLN
jgi:hypothetical protein